jgi:CHAT domain-containing protein
MNKPDKLSHQDLRKKINSLRQQIEKIEKRLMGKSTFLTRELQQNKITSKAISKSLKANSALVEFVKIPDFDFFKSDIKSWRYLAFILLPDGSLSLKDLGDAKILEKAASNVLKTLKAFDNPPEHTDKALNTLFKMVWLPLEKGLKDAENVWISPAGILNLISFAALTNDSGNFLLENYKLAYVTSGRDLSTMKTERTIPASDLLLVANPEYDRKNHEPAPTSSSLALRSRDFLGHFPPLPGTQIEAETLPAFIPGSGERKKIFTGRDATEEIVKSASAPRIMHLATHGFFLDENHSTIKNDLRGLQLIDDQNKSAPSNFNENPLVRSGLAFAGANQANEIKHGDDGILTALEISGINLYGTDLVVLSACETAVGEIKSGEGVFGLRRSFVLAGAQNLLMSLWPVADKITADQMADFYKNLKVSSPAESLRQAQLKTINQLKEQYGFAAPDLWAPFILQGASSFEKISWN